MINNLLYYGFHSFINQIKKLCKTWFLILLVACMLLGGIIGYTASRIDESIEQEEVAVEVVEDENLAFINEENSKALFEVIAGGIFAGLFVMMILTSNEKGINLFQPADVNILFTSPLSPQSVLMFRVLCQMGLYIFFAIYFMIEVPSLKVLFELSTYQSVMIVIGFVITLATSTFTSIYLSLVATKNTKAKTIIKYVTLGLIGVFALAFVLYWKSGNKEILDACLEFFNSKFILYIPVIGWLKGIIIYAMEERTLISILFIVLIILFNALMIFLTKNIKVDFYEEAMKKSEEIAELAAKMKEKGSVFAKAKKSDEQIAKEEKLMHNELNYGSGAQMFLVKSLYNRFRYAKFHIFTKTLITYLFVAVITSLIAIKAEAELLFIPAAAICVFVFFRTMGNPLREDTDNIYFLMAPQSAWSKLLYSILAGSINCLLDVLPGLVVAAILLKASALEVLGCLGFIVTLDFFSTSIGSFVNLSLPQNVGTTIKQTLQIMFLYFGLLPDILILVFGIINNHNPAGVILLTALINIVIGFVFIALAVPIIEPKGGIKVFVGKKFIDLKEAKNTFSSVGFMAFVAYIVIAVVQISISKFIQIKMPTFEVEGIWFFLLNSLPIYIIGMPVGYLLVKNREKRVPDKEPMKIKTLLKIIPVMCFFMLAGNLLGTILSLFFSTLANQQFVNPVQTVLNNQNIFVQILFVALIGPFFEELFFRKIAIDHLNMYGEKLAIVVSAVLFGLFHGNISQAIYASLLGLILGYVYTRTGNLKYSFILHALLNFFNGIVPTYILSNVNFEALEAIKTVEEMLLSDTVTSLEALGIFYIVEIVLAILGLIIFCSERRNLVFKEAEKEIVKNKRFNVGFLNPGVICFVILMLSFIANDYLGFINKLIG